MVYEKKIGDGKTGRKRKSENQDGVENDGGNGVECGGESVEPSSKKECKDGNSGNVEGLDENTSGFEKTSDGNEKEGAKEPIRYITHCRYLCEKKWRTMSCEHDFYWDMWPYSRPRMRLWEKRCPGEYSDEESCSEEIPYDSDDSDADIIREWNRQIPVEPPNPRTRKCGMLVKKDFIDNYLWSFLYRLWHENFRYDMGKVEFFREFSVLAKYRAGRYIHPPDEFWLAEMTPRVFDLVRGMGFTLSRRGGDNILVFDYITQVKWLTGGEWRRFE